MNSEEFKTIVEGCIANINGVLQKKSREYSSKDDKLHNFEQAKKIMRCNTKEYALWGMFAKHLVSITDMVEKYEKYGILPDENIVEEKIGDSINYHILLKACFLGDIYNKKDKRTMNKAEAEKENLCEKCLKVVDCDMVKAVGRSGKVTICEDYADLSKSLYKNPRKRLVVENLRKLLKPLFVWLTNNNRFVDYEKIKGILNKAELEADSVTDEFVKDVVVFVETVLLPIEMKETRERIIAAIVKPPMTRFKVGDFIVPIYYANHLNLWVTDKEVEIFETGIETKNKEICYGDWLNVVYMEKNCFKTRKEAQQECDKRNKSEKDVKDIFDTASDLTTAMIVNKRKKAVVDNMQDKLKPIIEYLMITSIAEYQRFANLCVTEAKMHDSITDKVFYQSIIMFLKSLSLPNEEQLPQYKFKTLAEIRDVIVEQLKDDLTRM